MQSERAPRLVHAGRAPVWGTTLRHAIGGRASRSRWRAVRSPSGTELRGWILLSPAELGRPAVILDELGDLWWAEIDGRVATLLGTCALGGTQGPDSTDGDLRIPG